MLWYIVEQDFIQSAIPGWKDEVQQLFLLFDDDNDEKVRKDDFPSCLRRNPLLIAIFAPWLRTRNLLGGNGTFGRDSVMEGIFMAVQVHVYISFWCCSVGCTVDQRV